jgi:protein required for attachment to host cells
MTFQDVEHLSYPDLLDCKQDTLGRLQGIVIKDVPRKKAGKQKNAASNGIPYTPKTDTHWDFLMKEMMWLGADFQGERKRQLSLAKKLASSVKQYHKTKEARRLRELQQAETKRRKLSAKISRDVKSWWIKIERVISYKQKIKADEERQKAMNKQLVVLVQQTERYSESLTKYRGEDTTDSDDDDTSMNSDSDVQTKGKRRRKRLTIEEALAMERKRKSKHKVVDYARMRLDNKAFYGESTASDSGSDASYAPESDTDDQTTLKEAMDDELLERKQSGTGNEIVFQADPEELRKLREEIEMDIQQVIDRFKLEGMVEIPEETESQSDPVNTQNKRVQFPETASEPVDTDKMDVDDPPLVKSEHVDPGNDADDDGDASDVEDYKHTQSDEDEFSDCEPEVDDETTIAQEEILPREISTQQEIDLLRKESEMSVEELRKLYSGMNEDAESSGEVSEEDEDAIDETINDDDKEFCLPVTAEVDDETTIEAEEKLGTEMSHDEEMALLQQDSNIPIEQLRAMSAAMENANGGTSSDDQVSDSNGTKKDFGGTHGSLTAALASQISEREGDFSDEFQPEASETVDDETTIEAEERLGRELSYDEEMNLLKNESEIPVEQLRAMYADVNGQSSQETNAEEYHTNAIKEAAEKLERAMAFIKTQNERPIEQLRSMYQAMADEAHDDESDATEITGSANGPASATVALLSSAGDVDVENDEYKPNAAEGIDDETTIEAEERLGREMSYDDELALLKKEKEMSVEELRAMYANMGSGNGEDDDGDDNDDLERSQNSKMGVDDNGESPSTSLVDTVSKRKRKYKETHDKTKKQRKDEPEADSDDGTNARSALRKDEPEADSDDGTTALSALEASAERARKTLASRPYMLASWVKLRKYQQVGLNWLVSLQSRRLNGILADGKCLKGNLRRLKHLTWAHLKDNRDGTGQNTTDHCSFIILSFI